jgi:beta-glucosidase
VPRLHLEGFQRVSLRAGEKEPVTFRLRLHQLVPFDDKSQPFDEPGGFKIPGGGGQPGDPHAGTIGTMLRVEACW